MLHTSLLGQSLLLGCSVGWLGEKCRSWPWQELPGELELPGTFFLCPWFHCHVLPCSDLSSHWGRSSPSQDRDHSWDVANIPISIRVGSVPDPIHVLGRAAPRAGSCSSWGSIPDHIPVCLSVLCVGPQLLSGSVCLRRLHGSLSQGIWESPSSLNPGLGSSGREEWLR